MHSKLPGGSSGDKRIYLVVATSGRAIAEALKASRYSVAVIDGFADVDTCAASVTCRQVSRTAFGLDEEEARQAVLQLQGEYCLDGLLYDAALESAPGLLEGIRTCKVIGNTTTALRRCKDPEIFFSTLDKNAVRYPDVCFSQVRQEHHLWLQKSSKGVGGMGITSFTGESGPDPSIYLQRKMEGLNFSLTFLADGVNIEVLGFNTLWHRAYGLDKPYVYEGAINRAELVQERKSTAFRYAALLTREFNLVGLNSIDFILSNDCVYVLEINPRIPATYELYETRQGHLIRAHMDACIHAKLARISGERPLRAHALVYAPEPVQVPARFDWPLWTADRPHPEEIIQKHEPVCSVFAGGKNVAHVRSMIRVRMQKILHAFAQGNW